MKSIILCLLAVAFTCAVADITGGKIEKSTELTPEIHQTLLTGLKDAANLDKSKVQFQVEKIDNVKLLKHTSQVVSGLLDTYVFSFTDASGAEQVSYITVWSAPWEPKAGLTSACIMAKKGLTAELSADATLSALKTQGNCVSK